MREETPAQREQRLEFEERCAKLGREIGDKLPENVGFAFFMFDFGGAGNLAYISNAKREDFMTMLHEFMAKFGGDHG